MWSYSPRRPAPSLPSLIALAVIGILYGACLALVQRDFWRLLAFAALSHLSLITLGIYGMTFTGTDGAIYQILNHESIDAALFVLLGAIEFRYATSQIADFGGLANKVPRLATLFVIVSLAMIGLPMLNGFVGEFMILSSTFTGVSRGGRLSQRSALSLARPTCSGWCSESSMAPKATSRLRFRANDLHLGESLVLWPLAVLMLVMGVAPFSLAPHRLRIASVLRTLKSEANAQPDIITQRSRGGSSMTQVPDIYRILPEVVLTLTGVVVMLIEPLCPPVGLAAISAGLPLLAQPWRLWSSLWQLSLPTGTGFSETVETSPFTVFFHVLICGIVLVALLLSLDTLPEDSHHQGEYYALIVFGAVGMCLLTGAVELLVVFIALEISSISTYILAGYRKQTGRGPEAAIKYFLLGSFATAFLLYGIALIFGATGPLDLRNRPPGPCGAEPALSSWPRLH